MPFFFRPKGIEKNTNEDIFPNRPLISIASNQNNRSLLGIFFVLLIRKLMKIRNWFRVMNRNGEGTLRTGFCSFEVERNESHPCGGGWRDFLFPHKIEKTMFSFWY